MHPNVHTNCPTLYWPCLRLHCMKYSHCNDLEIFSCYEWLAVLLLLTEIVVIVFVHTSVPIVFVVIAFSSTIFVIFISVFIFIWLSSRCATIDRTMDRWIHRYASRSLLQRSSAISISSSSFYFCFPCSHLKLLRKWNSLSFRNFYYANVVANFWKLLLQHGIRWTIGQITTTWPTN